MESVEDEALYEHKRAGFLLDGDGRVGIFHSAHWRVSILANNQRPVENKETLNWLPQILVFSLDEQRHALRVSSVERVVQAVEITPLPTAPAIILGFLNIQGRNIPVVNLRKWFGLRERKIELSDQFVIIRTSLRTFALVVDMVMDIVSCTEARTASSDIQTLSDGPILMDDLDRFLSQEEEKTLAEVMQPETITQLSAAVQSSGRTMSEPVQKDNKESEMLLARAKTLAREPGGERQSVPILEVLEFGLAHERYAFESVYVSEVYPLNDLTPLPCAPSFVRGLVNVRRNVLPVIDLKKFFDLPEKGMTDFHQVLLFRTPNMEFGILADTIVGVRGIAFDSIQSSISTPTGIPAEYLKAVTKEGLIILDGARILADPRIVVHDEVQT